MSDELADDFIKATRRDIMENREDVTLTIGSLELLGIVGQLQLALRHPANQGARGDLIRRFIDQVLELLQRVHPAYGILIEAGDDKRFDISG